MSARVWIPLVAILCLVGCGTPVESGNAPVAPAQSVAPQFPDVKPTEVLLHDDQGTSVYTYRFATTSKPKKGIILLFHQNGSNAAEFRPTAPRLCALGYDAVAVDLRRGGDMWGSTNQTAAQFPEEQPYGNALKDMRVALDGVEKENLPIFAIGSSFSASLVIRLAQTNSKVIGIVVFSPGEYFGQTGWVTSDAEHLKVPVLMFATPKEETRVEPIFRALGHKRQSRLVIADEVIHGASSLRTDKNPNGAETCWRHVEAFIKGLEVLKNQGSKKK